MEYVPPLMFMIYNL